MKDKLAELLALDLFLVKRRDMRAEEDPLNVNWSPYISGPELQNEVGDYRALIASTRDFFDPNSDLELLRLFLACRNWRVYPPAWLIDELAEKLELYVEKNLDGERRPLGDFLKISAKEFNQVAYKQLFESCHIDVERIRSWFKASLRDSSAVVLLNRNISFIGIEGFLKRHKVWKREHGKKIVELIREKPPTEQQRLTLLEMFENNFDDFDAHVGNKFQKTLSLLRRRKSS